MNITAPKSVGIIERKSVISVRDLGINFPAEIPTLRSEIDHLTSATKGWLRDVSRGGLRSPFALDRPGARGKWVFRNISFDVAQGEVLGIIGANGCGKTVLLKILSSVLIPTEGRVEIRGRVAALLAMGTGFNMEYTGRENIFLNGMILGLTNKVIEEKFDSICAFADIGDAIEMPVRTYSSGMKARLAFSVAAQLKSDIVILDEVLSVGDAGFREKSLEVIHQMKRDGRTILLVSHNMSVIENFCDQALLIRNGSIQKMGEIRNVVQDYLDSFKAMKAEDIPLRDRQDREGTGALRIVGFRLETGAGLRIQEAQAGDEVIICLDYECEGNRPVQDVDVGVAFFSDRGYKISRFATDNIGGTFAELPPKGVVKLKIARFPFTLGTYLLGFRITVGGAVADYIPNGVKITVGSGDYYGTGAIDDHSPVLVPHDWVAEGPANSA